ASRRLGSGMRGGGTGDRGVGQAAPSQSLAELRGSINAAFWQPLCYALTRLHVCPTAFTSLHVVTAPMHHSIPLESANEDFPAFYYCGLPAFVRLRRRERSDPTASSAWLAYDVAWSTAQPIPFVRAEAQLAEVVLACKGTVEQAPLDELPHRSAARLLLIGCHGDVGGTAQGRHGTLLLDAQTNRSMSTYEGTAIGAKYEEIIVSSCLAGLVGKARWGDALGLVPLWQTCSVATVVACVAPVHDFYMPLLTTLYLHHRLHRTESSVALRRAKSELLSGEWPEPFCQAVRVVYRSEMEHVLTRGAQGQHTDVCARIALGWPLVSAVKDELRNHLLDADKGNAALRALFSSVSARNAWIDAGLTALIDERWSRATSADPVHHMIRTALEHICAYTVCYGGSSAMYGKQ
ncbi:MAG: hypothetical protein IJH04_10410, partial [Eggerthellaceae bacterium]|nr:hypothetical protein [Eggerthellaceae bacterium]